MKAASSGTVTKECIVDIVRPPDSDDIPIPQSPGLGKIIGSSYAMVARTQEPLTEEVDTARPQPDWQRLGEPSPHSVHRSSYQGHAQGQQQLGAGVHPAQQNVSEPEHCQ